MYPQTEVEQPSEGPSFSLREWFDVTPPELSISYLGNILAGIVFGYALVHIIASDSNLLGSLLALALLAGGYSMAKFVTQPAMVAAVGNGLMLSGIITIFAQTDSFSSDLYRVLILLVSLGVALFAYGADGTKGNTIWLAISCYVPVLIIELMDVGFDRELLATLYLGSLVGLSYFVFKQGLSTLSKAVLAFAAVYLAFNSLSFIAFTSFSSLGSTLFSGLEESLLLVSRLGIAAAIVLVGLWLNTRVIPAVALAASALFLYSSPINVAVDSRVSGLVIIAIGLAIFAAVNFEELKELIPAKADNPAGIEMFDAHGVGGVEGQQWQDNTSFGESASYEQQVQGQQNQAEQPAQHWNPIDSGPGSNQYEPNSQAENTAGEQAGEQVSAQSAPSTQEQPVSVPPNWYPDPKGQYEFRWHDGQRWTKFVSVAGEQMEDPDT